MDGLDALLDRVPVTEDVRRELRRLLRAPDRHYHGARHVALLWQRHLRFRAGLAAPPEPWDTLIACAIAFHDAIHDPRRRDNEAASATLWREAAPEIDAAGVAWVAGTIEATADHLAARQVPGMEMEAWAARAWVLDLDLTPMGEPPREFANNTARLRREFAHLADADWEIGRLAFLSRLAASPRLFRSAELAAAFEASARRNLARELADGRAVR